MPFKSIFCSPWWLDATVQSGSWGVCEAMKNGQVVASMPWVQKNKFGLKIIDQPLLSQTLGPWLADPPKGCKYETKLSREKSLMTALIDQLPEYDVYRQNFSPEITNWMPFYWRGFKQTTRYTYRLQNLSNTENLWENLRGNIRQNIRNANKEGIAIERSNDIDALLDLNEQTFIRQGKRPPYKRSFIKHIFKACESHQSGTIFLARDADGKLHAGNFLIWNEYCAYYLMGGCNLEYKSNSAATLALWEAVKFSANVSQIFDFEGSMIAPIEHFFRGFGAIQTPYFAISHIPSKILDTAFTCGKILKSTQ